MRLIITVIFLFLFSSNASADGDIKRGKVAFQVCVGTVKLPRSDELNGNLTTYAKFWT